MEFLDTINGSIKKFGKGMFAIFLLKSLLFGIVLINQSCNNEEYYEEGINTNSDEMNAFFKSAFEVSKKYVSTNSTNENIGTKNDLIHHTRASSENSQSEEEAKFILEPVVENGIALLKSYGLTDDEIINEFGSLSEPEIVTAALAVYRTEELARDGFMIKELNEDLDYEFASLLSFSGYAYAQSGVGNCILEAIGVNAVIQGFRGGIKKLGKRGVLRLIRRVALRTLGWFGAAIAVVDFADCMGWFGDSSFIGGPTGTPHAE